MDRVAVRRCQIRERLSQLADIKAADHRALQSHQTLLEYYMGQLARTEQQIDAYEAELELLMIREAEDEPRA